MSSFLDLLVCITFVVFGVSDASVSSIELTRHNFDSQISAKNVLVAFYSPSSDSDDRFFVRFEKLAETDNVRNGVQLAYFDCDKDADFCETHNGKGLAVFLYPKGKDRVTFSGVKSVEGLSEFLSEQLVPKKLNVVNDLTRKTFKDHVAIGNHFVAFYTAWCPHSKELQPIWNELAKSLENDTSVSISRVDCDNYRFICEDFQVNEYPTIAWIVDGIEIEEYNGERSPEAFQEYIEEQMAKHVNAVIELTNETFNDHIANGNHFVAFYARRCKKSKLLEPIWNELAKSLRNDTSVSISRIDCDEYYSICVDKNFDIKRIPTIGWIVDGIKVEEYPRFGNRSVEAFQNYIEQHSDKNEKTLKHSMI